MDLGTGDGAAVLRRARREPGTLAIGVDTDAAAMREASRRAASKPTRGGLPNALFLAGAVGELSAALDGMVCEVRVTLPWGSLLRAARDADPTFVGTVLRLLQPGAVFRLLLSVTERDLAAGATPLDDTAMVDLAVAYGSAGFDCIEVRQATAADVDESGSTWAKRLGIPSRRPAWLLVAHRPWVPAGTGAGTTGHTGRV